MSKIFAATLVMMLVEDGALALDGPVDRWLPGAPAGVALEHLLSNTSGIGHWPDIPGADPQVAMSPDERLAAILRAPLIHEPGLVWRYSSPGFLAIGALVERVTGSRYPQVLADRILRPLGLSTTAAQTPPPDVAPGHHDGAPVEPWDLGSMTGTGDLWSTADDLLVFAQALDRGTLISAESLRMMRTQHAALPDPDRSLDGRLVITGYGYGVYVGTYDDRPAWLHTGDVPGYASMLGWLPDDVHVVCLSNDDTTRWEHHLPQR